MPQLPNIRRNIAESADNIYINRWWTGEITQRSPLFTPVSALGLQIIARHDAMYKGGSNMELSPNMTLVRRYGFSKYCTQAFGSSDYPLNFYSFKNTSGTIRLLVDTPTEVAWFNTSTITQLYSKGTTTQSSFQKVGSTVYICDGTNLKKWDQTNLTTWGITAPVAAPTLSFGAGSLSPQSGYQYVFVYKNSTSGHISTASPASANTGVLSAQNITVQGSYSTDTQVDKVDIYRTVDGGSLYYYLAEVANNSAGGTFTYVDSSADSALNTALIAPVAGVNNPPPAGLSLVTWHQDRLWGASGNLLYFSAGPDCTNGVAEEAWPAANVFKLPGAITALASISSATLTGLLVFTSSDMFIAIGTSTADFWVKPLQRNFGVLSQNCVEHDGSAVFVYTSKAQLFQIDSQIAEIGNAIGDQLLSTFPPATSYITMHRNGNDVGLWISDGVSNLKGYTPNWNGAWYPTGQITNGLTAIKSLETSAGNWSLLIGRSAGSGYILKRDTSLYTDDGTAYTCAGVVGNLIVSPPGDVSHISKVFVQAMPVGTYPTVSVLVNEISGTFKTLPNPVNDPTELDGTIFASSSVWCKRHYFKKAQSALPEHVQNVQVKLSFPAENFRGEILGLGIA